MNVFLTYHNIECRGQLIMTGIRTGSLSDNLHHSLREAILTVRIPPGTSLSEGELAREYGTSKTPVREALTRLCADGLVRVIPYKGYYVTPISLRDVQTLYQVRTVLETGAAELAATVISPEDAERLLMISRSEPTGQAGLMNWNTEFHLAIAAVTRNDRLRAILQDCLENLHRVLVRDIAYEDPYFRGREHVAIAERICNHDASGARQLVSEHIGQSQRRSLEQLLASGSIHLG
jgi:DNA-binding GntR family transcriptional regulator